MKRLWIAPALVLLMVLPATAQQGSSTDSKVVPSITVSPGQITPTPEMWFYEKRLQEYMDPKLAIRRVAEQRSAERRNRMAARKWFGYSNLRPVAGTDPYNGDYSPGWAGNNSLYPYRWSGYGPSWVVWRPTETASY
ncbi:MAG: hypothetical protein JW888_04160 [Pirellulales bacterium]|nr:hypothetical protein [Pirellulales bacterium]